MAIYLRGKKIAGGGRNTSTNNPALITYNTGDKTVVVQDDSVLVNANTLITYSEADKNQVQSQMLLPIVAGENVTFSSDSGKLLINSAAGGSTYTAGSGIKISNEDVISWNNPTIMEMSDVYGISESAGYIVKANTTFFFEDTGAKMLSEGSYSIPIRFGDGMSASIDGNVIRVSATGTQPTVQKFTRGNA